MVFTADVRAHFIARTVLQRDNGIEARRLAVDSLDEVFTIEPNTLSARFLKHAPVLGAQAGERALMHAGLQAWQVVFAMLNTGQLYEDESVDYEALSVARNA